MANKIRDGNMGHNTKLSVAIATLLGSNAIHAVPAADQSVASSGLIFATSKLPTMKKVKSLALAMRPR